MGAGIRAFHPGTGSRHGGFEREGGGGSLFTAFTSRTQPRCLAPSCVLLRGYCRTTSNAVTAHRAFIHEYTAASLFTWFTDATGPGGMALEERREPMNVKNVKGLAGGVVVLAYPGGVESYDMTCYTDTGRL